VPYLYGDSTPFPLEENFLETLRDVCETVAALLRADVGLMAARERAEEAKRMAVREQSKLEGMAAGLVRALEGPMQDAESPSTARVAGRVLQSARSVLEGARGETTMRRDEALRAVERELGDTRGVVMRNLEGLMARRQLPHTVWRLRWRAGAGDARAAATVAGSAPNGLETTLELDVPASHMWARAPRVKLLEKGLTLRLPREKSFLRSAGPHKEHLDGWVITEVEVAPERVALVLRRHAHGPAEGLELVVRDQSGPAPSARRLRPGGGPVGVQVVLDGSDARGLDRLWRRVAETMRDLERRRTRLVAAAFGGKPMSQLDRPARLASALVDAVAPFAREIRRRSPGLGELSLKRDLGGGRREELFVATAEIIRRLDGLGPGTVGPVLAALGLGAGGAGRDLGVVPGDDEQALEAALRGATEDVGGDSLMRALEGAAADLSDDAEEVSDDEETREAGHNASRPMLLPPLPDVQSEDRTGVDQVPPGRVIN
jgi:hypothetical protein